MKTKDNLPELSEDLFSTILESLPFMRVSVDNNVIFVSDLICKLSGYQASEVLNKNMAIFKSDYHTDEYYEWMMSSIRKGKEWQGDMNCVGKNGVSFWLDLQIKPVVKSGVIQEFLIICKDITYRKELERNLLLQKERMELVFDGSNTGLWDWNPKTNQVYFNESWCKMLGHEQHEIKPTLSSWQNLVHPDDIEKCLADIKLHMDGLTDMYSNVHRMKHREGHWIYILDKGRIYERDEAGHPIRFTGTHNDISEQVWVQNAFNEISQSAKIGSWEYDILKQKINWSQVTYQIHETTPEEHVPDLATGIDFYYEDDKKIITEHFSRIVEQGGTFDLELRIKTKKNNIVWVRSIGKTQMINNMPYKVFGTFQDINEKKLMELKIQESKERLDLALMASKIGIWDWHLGSGDLFWDEQMFSVFEIDKKDFKNNFESWSKLVDKDDLEEANKQLQMALTNKTLFNTQFRIITHNNKTKHIKAIARAYYDSKGEPIRMVGCNWDISYEMSILENANMAKQKAEEAYNVRTRFLANMSHEIRTPLNSILGMTELLQDTELDRKQKEMLHLINFSGEALLKLINDILELSKIEAGELNIINTNFKLADFIQSIYQMFKVATDKKKIDFSFVIDKDVPAYLNLDKFRLQQVLINLISNAVKFTEKGEVVIEVGPAKKRTGGHLIEFRVKDTGLGFDDEDTKKLFQPFKQLDDSPTRKYGGTGLGLAICKELVFNLGGDISVKSKKGEGSEFIFSVFSNTADKSEIVEIDIDQEIKNLGDYSLKILVAEDNNINQILIKAYLKKFGFDCFIAENGEQVVKAVESNDFDLILMDLQMPVMDGLEACRQIRKMKKKQPIIVAMTANTFDEDRNSSFESGMDEFLTKPIKKTDLVRIFKKFRERFS
ncbi:MAG: PAS domain-containing protein [Bacteriovoracaceae bacterium]|nr:PAS domain-containing protein [Bacteriovoracaceae bacterium]